MTKQSQRYPLTKLFKDYSYKIVAAKAEQDVLFNYLLNSFEYDKCFPELPNPDILVREIIERYCCNNWGPVVIAYRLNAKYSWILDPLDSDKINLIINEFTEEILRNQYYVDLLSFGFQGLYQLYVKSCTIVGRQVIGLPNYNLVSVIEIDDLNISELTKIRLRKANINTVEDVINAITDKDLIKKTHIGKKRFDELIDSLRALGYSGRYFTELTEGNVK
jgi:hypothetical protein